MNYTREQFHADVTAEAKALREHATREELQRLDIEELIPCDTERCIYGQMTGDCDSVRASELIKLCTNVYFEDSDNISSTRTEFRHHYWSPIEAYITQPESNNPALIAYLRGETDTLTL